MFRKMFSCGSVLLLAGATILVTPGIGQARGGGGGFHGGGGARLGRAHFGGARFGVEHEGFNHPGYAHGYYRPYYEYRHHYGDYPYYFNYYYPAGSYTYPYAGPDLGYDSGYYNPSGEEAPSSSDEPPAAVTPGADTGQPPGKAYLTVKAPADAQVWFDGTKTAATGSVRQYQSPPLTPGRRYGYVIRARWDEDGHEVTQTQEVEVTAGSHKQVVFPIPPSTAGQAAAVKKGTR